MADKVIIDAANLAMFSSTLRQEAEQVKKDVGLVDALNTVFVADAANGSEDKSKVPQVYEAAQAKLKDALSKVTAGLNQAYTNLIADADSVDEYIKKTAATNADTKKKLEQLGIAEGAGKLTPEEIKTKAQTAGISVGDAIPVTPSAGAPGTTVDPSKLTWDQLQKLTPDQLKALDPTKLTGLTDEQWTQLKAKIAALNPVKA